jgi:hypothetical protein
MAMNGDNVYLSQTSAFIALWALERMYEDYDSKFIRVTTSSVIRELREKLPEEMINRYDLSGKVGMGK